MSLAASTAASELPPPALSPAERRVVLAAAFLCWLGAGVQMGLVQLSSRPALVAMFQRADGATGGDAYAADEKRVGDGFARQLAALQFGAAVGGVLFGRRADRRGRSHAMGLSVLCYSLCAGAAFFAQSPTQLLFTRFLTGLGIGGAWPTAVALAGEAWPNAAKPKVAGVIGVAANLGILLVAHIASEFAITTSTWRVAVLFGAGPALLGILVYALLPESPSWLATRTSKSAAAKSAAPVRELFRPALLRNTLIGIALATVPLLGAWGSSKWMFPWADKVAHNQAETQAVWAYGAVIASALGGWIADLCGRRITYFTVSLASLVINLCVYQFLQPGDSLFLPAVFFVGLSGTLFFGWLPLYLPELFPTAVRATGIGLTYNSGRIATAFGILGAGLLMQTFDGKYELVGTTTSCVYALGMIVILFAPVAGKK